MSGSIILARACALVAGLACAMAQAASNLLIWPIDPILANNDQATQLWIENQGSAPATMQVRVVRWRQEQGMERYSAQQDVVASPPIVRVNQGSKQLVRLIRQTPTPAGQEWAYRVVVDEIPQPQDDTTPQVGIKLQMRYSIPLFAYGQGLAARRDGASHVDTDPNKLAWRIVNEQGRPWLRVSNASNVHVRLSNVRLGNVTLADGLLGYVLPGSERSWELPPSAAAASRLTASINAPVDVWQAAPSR